jgi:mannosyltransferase
MRVPSVISMAGAAALIAVIGRRLTGSGWAGLFAGCVMAATPTISYYAQTARSYALVFACVLGETLVLLHALQAEADGAPRAQVIRRWLAYAVLVVLAGYLNEMSLLALAGHAVTVLIARYGKRAFAHWAVTAAGSALLVSPLIAISVLQNNALSWISRPDLHDVWILYHDYFGATLWAPLLVAACAVVAVLPSGGGRSRGTDAAGQAWWRGGVSVPSVAAPLLVIPAALLLGESLVASPLYVDRYVLYGEAGAALLAGAGLCRIGGWLARAARRPRVLWVPGIAICALALVLQITPQQRVRTPGSRLFNFGGPAFYIGANARPGDGVMFFASFFRKAELGYPVQFRDTRDLALAVPPSVARPFKGIDKPFSAVRPLMLQHSRIWVIGRPPSASLPAGILRQESDVLLQNFTRTAARAYRGMWVTLWQRRS